MTEQQIFQAYEMLKDYCDKNNTDVVTLVNDEKNIKPASIEIHSQLSWLVKKAISPSKIETLIMAHIDFIREKAHFYHNATISNPTTPKNK